MSIHRAGSFVGTVMVTLSASAGAAGLPVVGGPAYVASGMNGYTNANTGGHVVGAGLAVGYAKKNVSGNDLGFRGIAWTTAGTFSELQPVSTIANGSSATYAMAWNPVAGQIVGWGNTYTPQTGTRAIRWDTAGNPTVLGTLGQDAQGQSFGFAYAVNDTGVVAGRAGNYVNGALNGYRATRWTAAGQAIALDPISTFTSGFTDAQATAINNAGTAVGWGYYYGATVAERPVRWLGNTTAASPLGLLGTKANGDTAGRAVDINNAGTAVGYVAKYVNNVAQGERPVRWDADNDQAFELWTTPTGISSATSGRALGINAGGSIFGSITKPVDQFFYAQRAVRWDTGHLDPIELGTLNTGLARDTLDTPAAMNDAGWVVGTSRSYNISTSNRAVVWQPDGTVINLNTVIDPASGWTLISASGIDNNNWVSGVGTFDPDGPGGQDRYDRLYLIQVPEPAVAGLACLAPLLMRRKRGTN